MCGGRHQHSSNPELQALLLARREEFVRYVGARVGTVESAEDLVHDVLTRNMERLSSLREPKAIVAWIYQSLRNAIVDHHRRRGASKRALSAVAQDLDKDTPQTAPANPCQCIKQLAQSLKPELATALRRLEVDGLSMKDFAVEAGISSNYAAVRAHRARAALKKSVLLTCGACAEMGCIDCTCECSARCA